MGFLQDVGPVYDYYESLAFQKLIKEKGIIQFLHLMKKYEDFQVANYNYEHVGDSIEVFEESKQSLKIPCMRDMKIYWGDEFEGHVVLVCKNQKKVCIQPNTGELFKKLQENQQYFSFVPLPEYGSWMLENTPNKPYYHLNYNADSIITNIRSRIQQIQNMMPPDTYYLLMPVFPRLGCIPYSVQTDNDLNTSYMEKVQSKSSYLEHTPTENHIATQPCPDIEFANQSVTIEQSDKTGTTKYNLFSQSQFLDDRIINPHPRYSTLTMNLRLRRGSKINIQAPLFRDLKTSYEKTEDEPYPGQIYMDHMGFGMGNCCLQMTFLSMNIDHARFLYDQFAPLSPLFMALTAGSPIFKGQLSDWDTKWEVLSMSVDDRNERERDPSHLDYIPKSRYSSISYYMSNHRFYREEYNDIPFRKNEEIMLFAKLKAEEMGIYLDDRLIKHLGFMFIRDSMVIFKDKVQVDDSTNTNHFENIQSTNWNSVRFKPPPSQDSKIGWRVEFRTSEIQITADENAAISIFLLKIAQLFYFTNINLNFYMPLSLVDENFKRARNSNAIINEKFYWRRNIQDEGPAQIVEMSLDEIFFGKPEIDYIGIHSIIQSTDAMYNQAHVHEIPRSQKSDQIYKDVYDYVRSKTTGKVNTLAQWMRKFVTSHPLYQKDSIVNDDIQYDMINQLLDIAKGQHQSPDFPIIFKHI